MDLLSRPVQIFRTMFTKYMYIPVSAMAGLRPGLLQKYQNAVTADEKFALLKAFMLDPLSMADVTIEASYVELSKEEDKAKWVELPLSQLRKEFTSEAEKRFLQEKIVNVQPGRAHPQDSTGEDTEMRLYWVFREGSGVSKQSREVGTKVTGKGSVPANKAARTAVADALVGRAADFSRKGAPSSDMGKGAKGKTKPGKAGGKTKNTSTRKARVYELLSIYPISMKSFPIPDPYRPLPAYMKPDRSHHIKAKSHQPFLCWQAVKEVSEDDRKKKEFKTKLDAYGAHICSWGCFHQILSTISSQRMEHMQTLNTIVACNPNLNGVQLRSIRY